TYAFDLDRPALLVASLTSSDFDTVLYVMDESGAVVAENDDTMSSTDSQAMIDLEPGRYYVVASSWSAESGASYTLELNLYVPLRRAHAPPIPGAGGTPPSRLVRVPRRAGARNESVRDTLPPRHDHAPPRRRPPVRPLRLRHQRAAGGPHATASAGGVHRSGPHRRPREATTARDPSRPAELGDLLRSSRYRQAHAGARHRQLDQGALHRHQRRPRRRQGHPRGGGAGTTRASGRQAHHPLRRRGAPLQQSAAGRAAAVGRERHGHPGRRD